MFIRKSTAVVLGATALMTNGDFAAADQVSHLLVVESINQAVLVEPFDLIFESYRVERPVVAV